jgi:hypothetical protein
VGPEAYTNVDYAVSIVDRRLTTRYCIFLCGNLVTWKSKKQSVVCRSSLELVLLGNNTRGMQTTMVKNYLVRLED